MTDVKRWLDDGASEPIRELLTAAREERPNEAGIQRTLVAVGLGSAVATGASHAAGGAAATLAKGATGVSTLGVVTKWGAIGALGAITTFGAVHVASKALEPTPVATAVTPTNALRTVESKKAVAPLPAREEDTVAAPIVEPETIAQPAPAAAARASRASPTTQDRASPGQPQSAAEAERILEEVRAIDRARSALARGDGRGTLAALDGYRSGFTERRFEPEALYLRMEALGQLGDTAGAKAAAERLLAVYPNAPQAARAHVVAGR